MGELLAFPQPDHEHQDHEHQVVPEPRAEHDQVVPDQSAGTVPLTGDVLPPRWAGPVERRPVVAPWLVNRADRRAAARWAARHVGHHVAFHAVRTPIYGARLVGQSPRGLGRTIAAVARWLADAEAHPLRRDMVAGSDVHGYLALVRQRNERIRARLITAGVSAGGGVGGGVALWDLAPHGVAYAGVAAVVAALGVAGRRADRPLVDTAVTLSGPAPRLTADVVIRALGALGIGEINKALGKGGDGITFGAPITRDGPGWLAVVDLPHGVTATDVIGKREALASGLRRPLGCVWPEPVHDAHTGRLALWVADQDMSQARPAPWPLAKTGTVDLFGPIPWGVDPRGRLVAVTLAESNVLIGAMPGAGKTFALRVLLLAAALDPRVQLDVFELKGSGDLSPLAPVCHDYASGGGDAAALAALERLREVATDLERRAATLSGLPREVAPDSKVTPALAKRRNLGLHQRVVAIDECQQLFAHPEYGKEAGELCVRIIKLGRALGTILILATQRPDKDSLPKAISANVGIRYCLRMMGHVENDMVLGTGAHRVGIRATELTTRDKGIGWLVGAGEEAVIMRGAMLDGPASERIVTRARAAREAAGTLSGYAIGEHDQVDTGPDRSILVDLVTVWPAGEDKAHADTLCALLAEMNPGRYAGWQPAQLSAALKPAGIRPRDDVWATLTGTDKKSNRTGYHRSDLTPDA